MIPRLFPYTLAILATAALTACGGGGGDTTTTTTTSSTTSTPIPLADCGLPDFKNEVLSRLNAYRTSGLTCGTEVMAPTTPVVWNEQLQQAATAHATDMAKNNFLGHIGSDGSTSAQRIARYGYVIKTLGFENAGIHPTSVTSVEIAMKGWRDSAPHCQAMMRREIKDIAVSCMANPALPSFYWAMEGGG